jgi:hypothetical protein
MDVKLKQAPVIREHGPQDSHMSVLHHHARSSRREYESNDPNRIADVNTATKRKPARPFPPPALRARRFEVQSSSQARMRLGSWDIYCLQKGWRENRSRQYPDFPSFPV